MLENYIYDFDTSNSNEEMDNIALYGTKEAPDVISHAPKFGHINVEHYRCLDAFYKDQYVTQKEKPNYSEPVPKQPIIVLPNHFQTKNTPRQIIEEIFKLIDKNQHIDYIFMNDNWRIQGAYSNRSKYFEFHINIYKIGDSNIFIVEMQRMTGDRFSFHNLFGKVRNVIINIQESVLESSEIPTLIEDTSQVTIPSDFDDSILTKEEKKEALRRIIQLTPDQNEKSKLEVCRIMCDLSGDAEIRNLMYTTGCLDILFELFRSGIVQKPICKMMIHQTIIALADFSECEECQESIIKSGHLPDIMMLGIDGPYTEIAMRRDSARIFANIAEKKSHIILEYVSRDEIINWLASVENMVDTRLKQQTDRASEYMKKALEKKK